MIFSLSHFPFFYFSFFSANKKIRKVEYHSGDASEDYLKLLKSMSCKDKCTFSPYFLRFYSPRSNIIFKIPFESKQELESFKTPVGSRKYDPQVRKRVMQTFYRNIHSEVHFQFHSFNQLSI